MYVVVSPGCWFWVGGLQKDGYGHLKVNGKMTLAHRWMYEWRVGPIPQGLTLDHLCRVRRCCNPAHLEPVTNRVNQERGLNSYAIRTLCRKGLHDISDPRGVYRTGSAKTCLECRRESSRKASLRNYYKNHAQNRARAADRMRRIRSEGKAK